MRSQRIYNCPICGNDIEIIESDIITEEDPYSIRIDTETKHHGKMKRQCLDFMIRLHVEQKEYLNITLRKLNRI